MANSSFTRSQEAIKGAPSWSRDPQGVHMYGMGYFSWRGNSGLSEGIQVFRLNMHGNDTEMTL